MTSLETPEEFHARVAEGYRQLADADPTHWVVVDGQGSVDAVADRVLLAVDERLAVDAELRVGRAHRAASHAPRRHRNADL